MICLVSFVLVLAAGVATADNTTGLVGYYPFDEGAGTIAHDMSGNGHDGTLPNSGVTWIPSAVIKGGINIDGTNGSNVTLGTWDPAEGTGQLSLAFWINWAHDGNINQGLISKRDSGWGINSMMFDLRLMNATDSFRFHHAGGALLDSPSDVLTPFIGEWAHVGVTFDGTTARLYLNGEEIASGAFFFANKTTAEMRIGSYDGPAQTFNGDMDEVRIYNRALTQDDMLEAMTPLPPGQVSRPSPTDGATDVPRDNMVLSWKPGDFADKHDVYIGAGFDDVNDATASVDPAGVYMGRQSEAAVALDRLEFGQTYYWRIDEVNAPSDLTVFKGSVWSFTVEPVGYSMPSESITATASSSNSTNEGPEKTINGSGVDADDLHSMLGTDMWLSDSEPLGAWIQYEFDRIYKLHELWVWNSNQMLESTVGFGLKAVAIEYSADGTDWIELVDAPEFAQAPGTDGYAHSTTVDLGGIAAKYVRLTASSNWGGFMPKYGLSEVRFFYIPVHASKPGPDSGATDVSIGTIDEPVDVTLGFRAGREASAHDVYLSTDEQAVIDGTAPVTTVSEAGYGPLSLDIGQTYYWRVDEVNDAEVPVAWQGDIWSFATQEYFVVDDFEDYNDYTPDEIFSTWTDGWGIATNGALVANDEPPFAETAIVHEGSQAMAYRYDNSAGNSEASVAMSSARRDWTGRGIGALSLWFRGYPASVGSFAEAPAGTYTLNGAGWNIWDASDGFHFAYKTLNGPGSIVAKVESVQNTNDWAKGGVMVRDTLDPGSANGAMFISPANAVGFQRRLNTGEQTTKTQQDGVSIPQWVKIEVEASGAVRASYSADGAAWTELDRDAIKMSTPMYIGLAVTSRNADLSCATVFSDVRLDGAVSGEWMNQDIGILSNAPEPMYVALANSGGTPAAVYHPDPNATQADTWTEWNIDLKQFADQGVNLANVGELSIGLGDRDNPQPGSSGKMYFDDIRLHPLREPEPEPEPEPQVDLTGILLNVTDGLVGYYPLDEGAGNTAFDLSGNGHDGTLPDGGVTWIPSAALNGGINIDGEKGSDIKLGTWDPAEGTGQLSLAFWINWVQSGNVNQGLISKRTAWNTDGMMFDLRLRNDNNSFRLLSVGGGTILTDADVLTPFIGQWAHVAATFDGTTAKLYLNGQEVGSGAFSLDNGTTAEMRIGSYNSNSPTFNGDMDEVRIYNRALTQADFAGN
jgi:hypothetical protein